MAKRIAISIVVTVLITLVIGGLSAFYVTRAVLLSDLDDRIMVRAHALSLQLIGQKDGLGSAFKDDRYLVQNDVGRTLERIGSGIEVKTRSEILSRKFAVLADNTRFRSLSIRFQFEMPDDQSQGMTIVYSSACKGFDTAMRQLVIAFVIIGIAIGVVSIIVVKLVTQRVLRPLRQAVQSISSVNEHNLDSKLEPELLEVEFQPVARTVNQLLDRLQKSLDRRKQFLADASHELRTPITAMFTSLEVALRRTQNETDVRDTLESCLSDASVLKCLVNDLFEQVRNDQLSRDETYELVDLEQLLVQCVEELRTNATRKRVDVKISCEDIDTILTIPRRVRSIVANLVGNAIEYHQGGGEIQIRAVRQMDEWTMEFIDDGPGIAEEHLPRLFDPFFRATTSSDSHVGLGLFLVRMNTEVLNGNCQVASKLGEGTTFTVRLKMPVAQPATDLVSSEFNNE